MCILPFYVYILMQFVNTVYITIMKIGTLNVNGFVDSTTKRSLIFKFMKENNLDVICLQETHFNNNDNITEFF